jgi:hypothetical protein
MFIPTVLDTSGNEHAAKENKRERIYNRRLSLFPSAVRTASGSKGIISVPNGHP